MKITQKRPRERMTSTIESKWHRVSEGPWSKRRKHQSIVWNNKILILGGFDGDGAYDLNDVWQYDSDGWTLVTPHAGWSGRDGHQAVVMNDAIFVLGGTDDPYSCKHDVWKSSDGGVNWTNVCLAPWPERWQHGACVHSGRMFVTGGWGDRYLNDVWSSSDGLHWIQACSHAPWKARMFHSTISFNGCIYIIGGHDGHMQLRDVWGSSDDGLTWTQVCSVAQWEGRQGHASVALGDHVYLMGGFGGATRFNDMWKSKDCAHWTLVDRQCEWSPRQGHAAIAHMDCLHIIGGFSESGYCNDMHCYTTSAAPRVPRAASDLQSSSVAEATAVSGSHSHGATIATTHRRERGDSQSQLSTGKAVTVSMACVLESIKAVKARRSEREEIIRSILSVVAFVSDVVHNNSLRKLDLSEVPDDDVDESGVYPSLSKFMTLFQQGSPLRESLIDPNASMAARNGMPTIVSKEDLLMHFWRVLPLATADSAKLSRERSNSTPKAIKKKVTAASSRDLATVLSNPGTDYDLLPDRGDAAEVDDDREAIDQEQVDIEEVHVDLSLPSADSSYSSAALREFMDKERVTIVSLQRRIRDAAEKGDLETMERLVSERTRVSSGAADQAKKLLDHIIFVHKVQLRRERLLSHSLSRLEEVVIPVNATPSTKIITSVPVFCDSASAEDSESMSVNWSDWESITHDSFTAATVASHNSQSTELAISQFCGDLNEQSRACLGIQSWVSGSNQPTNSASGSITQQDSSSQALPVYQLSSPDDSIILQLSQDYEVMAVKLDKSKMEVKKAIDVEIETINNLEDETNELWRKVLSKGRALIRGAMHQNRIDTLNISSMKSEVASWMDLINVLSDREQMQRKIDGLLQENATTEENLLHLEDKRIDLRSMLEKASLKGQRRNTRLTTSRSNSTGDSDLASGSHDDIEDLKIAFAEAERAVKEARRDMRAWFRGVRQYAVDIAPELFHLLPDLQAPGSVLGDGGFAESAKLPKRRLAEYDDIRPLVLSTIPAAVLGADGKHLVVPASKPQQPSGRHVMLRAVYDGEEVVLKGFIMHEGDQRRGFEREISILGGLRNDHIICPRAVVEDTGAFAYESPSHQVAVYIEYKYYKGGNLSNWLKAATRKPWELQGVARQLLYGLMYLHDHLVVHKDVKPSNVLLSEDGTVTLADFELSRELKSLSPEDEQSTTTRSGTRGFMAPEIESGEKAVTASDMYSFGVLLLWMHFPKAFSSLIPGASPAIPASGDPEVSDLIRKLLVLKPAARPTAAAALMHPYFRGTYFERLVEEGEVVEQNRKLEAVRSLLHRVRAENRTNLSKITIHRDRVCEEVLHYFRTMNLATMKASIRVTFVGEVGVDEGGLLTEMFSIFFEQILSGNHDLFVGCEAPAAASDEETQLGQAKVATNVVLPNCVDVSELRLENLRAFGRAMIKSLYEGRRVGSRLCASVFKFITGTAPDMRDLQTFDPQTARSLQWTLATVGVEDFGLHFESVGHPDLGPVDDLNKAKFVRLQIDRILVHSRQQHLSAIKDGFTEALQAISSDAAPFMSLLSHTDWRVMLCGDTAVSAPQVVAALKFSNFPKKSNVPQWLKEILLSSSDDHLRQFLVFVTGSPSLQSSTATSSRVEINVRYQARSAALPIAHTCFFHLDIPYYKDKETLQTKLVFAMQNATTFEIV